MIDTRGLRLDQAPPIHLPFRLFLTAPWFAVAAGVLMVVAGDAALGSRWSPYALAATHLLTVGFLGQVMCGALLQMLPVIAGAPIRGVAWVGAWTHVLLSLGAGLMAGGFLGLGGTALWVGAACAALGFTVFLAGAIPALARARGDPGTVTALRLAALSLVVTVALGLVLVAALMGWLPLPNLASWVEAHAFWGLFGWVGLLIVGVAYQVLPLFYVAPAYPRPYTLLTAPALFVLILAAAVLLGTGRGHWSQLASDLIALGFAGFAAVSLVLQAYRERPRADPTLVHWRLAMVSVLGTALGWWLGAAPELLGVLMLVGVGVGLPSGMLLKIVPFLAWFHLQSRQIDLGRLDVRIPHMHRLLPEGLARWHPLLHALALALLLGAALDARLAWPGGLVLTASALWLLALMSLAAWRYRRATLDLADPRTPSPL